MFKAGFGFYLVIIMFGISKFDKAEVHMENIIMQVDFQDFFENDTVALKINDCLIFTNAILKSHDIIGITDMSVKFEQKGEGYKCAFKDSSVTCDRFHSNVKIQITLNRVLREYNINVDNGKYIGFSKKSKNDLDLIQSVSPFHYF